MVSLEEEKDEKDYIFYLRPYIPCWSAQNLLFEEIASLDKIPSQRNEKMYPRYVLEKLGRTWISNDPLDKQWFDQENVFQELKEDLASRLQSKHISKSTGKIQFCFGKKCSQICISTNF